MTLSSATTMRDSSPVSPVSSDERSTDPELAKYLNRDYWEQRNSSINTNGSSKLSDEIANPTAPSPMVTPQPTMLAYNVSKTLI